MIYQWDEGGGNELEKYEAGKHHQEHLQNAQQEYQLNIKNKVLWTNQL